MRKKQISTVSAGGVVVSPTGDILIVSQRGNSWSLPKGHLEQGESLLDAAKREIAEESGITDLTYIADLGSYQRHRIGKDGVGEDTGEKKTIHLFLFHTTQTILQPGDVKHPEARWIPRQEVARYLTHPKDSEFFVSLLPQLSH